MGSTTNPDNYKKTVGRVSGSLVRQGHYQTESKCNQFKEDTRELGAERNWSVEKKNSIARKNTTKWWTGYSEDTTSNMLQTKKNVRKNMHSRSRKQRSCSHMIWSN